MISTPWTGWNPPSRSGNLVARFAMAYDARDLETIAGLYAPDVRDGLMATLLERMPKGRTFHLTASPVVTFETADVATAMSSAGRRPRPAISGWSWACATRPLRPARRAWYLHSRELSGCTPSDVLARP